MSIQNRLASGIYCHCTPTSRDFCHHYRPTGRGNKCPFKTDQPVAYGYRSCHHYRPEHSMSKNEYCYTQLHCTLTPSEPWRRIFSNMLRGLASASKPLGLTPVGSENLFDGIEPSINKNQHLYKQLHCKPTQYKALVGIFSNK